MRPIHPQSPTRFCSFHQLEATIEHFDTALKASAHTIPTFQQQKKTVIKQPNFFFLNYSLLSQQIQQQQQNLVAILVLELSLSSPKKKKTTNKPLVTQSSTTQLQFPLNEDDALCDIEGRAYLQSALSDHGSAPCRKEQKPH